MKQIKKYVATLLMLLVVASSFIIPAAHSFAIDWNIKTDSVYFEYDYGIDITVEEELHGNIKSDVKLKNTGKSPAYVKAAVVFTPISKTNGQVLSNVTVQPEDVSINWNTNAFDNGSWITIDGTISNSIQTSSNISNSNCYSNIYIWNRVLTPDESTENLINSVQVNTADYNVRVDIITDAIYEGDIESWCSAYNLSCDVNTRTISVN